MGIGKSHAIRAAIQPHIHSVGGFFVQRQMRKDDLLGFRLCPVCPDADYTLYKQVDQLPANSVFIACVDGKWSTNLEVFQREATATIRAALLARAKVIVLDETGGLELFCPGFLDTLALALRSTACVGVLKSPANTRKMTQTMGTDKSLCTLREEYIALLRDSGARVETMNADNRDSLSRQMAAFVEQQVARPLPASFCAKPV